MTALEPTLAGRQGLILQDTWWHVVARLAPCVDLKLVCRGTWSVGYRHQSCTVKVVGATCSLHNKCETVEEGSSDRNLFFR
jgi:hypothetical protein